MTTTITTLETGNVQVQREYFDGEEMTKTTQEYTAHGAYVYAVNPNGSMSQVCEGLLPTGNTLRAGGDLAATIRQTLGQ